MSRYYDPDDFNYVIEWAADYLKEAWKENRTQDAIVVSNGITALFELSQRSTCKQTQEWECNCIDSIYYGAEAWKREYIGILPEGMSNNDNIITHLKLITLYLNNLPDTIEINDDMSRYIPSLKDIH